MVADRKSIFECSRVSATNDWNIFLEVVHGHGSMAGDPASRASFISLCFNSYYTEKKPAQICFIFWSRRSPILGLFIPVYRGQIGFSSASINFNWAHCKQIDRSKTLEVALLRAEPFLGTKHMYRNCGSACWVMAGLTVHSHDTTASAVRDYFVRPWCLRLTIVFQSYKSLLYKYMFQKSPFCKNHVLCSQ